MYVDVRELIPDDAPTSLGKYARMNHYVDANLFHEQLDGRSVTVIIDLAYINPVDWYNKKQSAMKTDIYGSDCFCPYRCGLYY